MYTPLLFIVLIGSLVEIGLGFNVGCLYNLRGIGSRLQLVPDEKSGGNNRVETGVQKMMLKSRSIGDMEAQDAETVAPLMAISTKKNSDISTEVIGEGDDGTGDPLAESGKERSSLFWRGCVVALCFVWSTQFAVVQKIFQEAPGLDPAAYAAVRFSIAATALLPTYAKYLSDLEFVKDCFIIGFLVFIAFVGQSTGLKMGAASDKVAFIASLTVVWVPIQKAFQTGNFKDQKWSSVLLAIVGIAFLELESAEPPGLGDLFAFLQPVGFGSSLIVLENVAKKLSADQGPSVAGMRSLGIAVPCIAWAALEGQLTPDSLTPIMESNFAIGGILYLALFTTAGMWYLQTFVTPNVKATDFALILASEPIFATLIAIAWLGEEVGAQEIVGGLLVVIACISADVSLVPPSKPKDVTL